jgi:hypothetical protein
MWIERDHAGGPSPGALQEPFEDALMTPVEAVEHTDRRHLKWSIFNGFVREVP